MIVFPLRRVVPLTSRLYAGVEVPTPTFPGMYTPPPEFPMVTCFTVVPSVDTASKTAPLPETRHLAATFDAFAVAFAPSMIHN